MIDVEPYEVKVGVSCLVWCPTVMVHDLDTISEGGNDSLHNDAFNRMEVVHLIEAMEYEMCGLLELHT